MVSDHLPTLAGGFLDKDVGDYGTEIAGSGVDYRGDVFYACDPSTVTFNHNIDVLQVKVH